MVYIKRLQIYLSPQGVFTDIWGLCRLQPHTEEQQEVNRKNFNCCLLSKNARITHKKSKLTRCIVTGKKCLNDAICGFIFSSIYIQIQIAILPFLGK